MTRDEADAQLRQTLRDIADVLRAAADDLESTPAALEQAKAALVQVVPDLLPEPCTNKVWWLSWHENGEGKTAGTDRRVSVWVHPFTGMRKELVICARVVASDKHEAWGLVDQTHPGKKRLKTTTGPMTADWWPDPTRFPREEAP